MYVGSIATPFKKSLWQMRYAPCLLDLIRWLIVCARGRPVQSVWSPLWPMPWPWFMCAARRRLAAALLVARPRDGKGLLWFGGPGSSARLGQLPLLLRGASVCDGGGGSGWPPAVGPPRCPPARRSGPGPAVRHCERNFSSEEPHPCLCLSRCLSDLETSEIFRTDFLQRFPGNDNF